MTEPDDTTRRDNRNGELLELENDEEVVRVVNWWLTGKGRPVRIGHGREIPPPLPNELDSATLEQLETAALKQYRRKRANGKPTGPLLEVARKFADFLSDRDSGKRHTGDKSSTVDRTDPLTTLEAHETAAAANDCMERLGINRDKFERMCRNRAIVFVHERFRKQGYYYEDEETDLKAAVRVYCEQQYLATWSRSWDPSNDRLLRVIADQSTEHDKAEDDARSVLEELRPVLKKIASRSARIPRLPDGTPTVGGMAVRLLCSLPADATLGMIDVIDNLGPTGYLGSSLHKVVAFSRLEDFRQRLGINREPTAEELTVIALLAGHWPEIKSWPRLGIAAKELVKRRAMPTVSAAIEQYSAWDAQQAT